MPSPRPITDLCSPTGSVRYNGSTRKLEAHPEAWSADSLVALSVPPVSGTIVTPDLAQGNYFRLTLVANIQIANPIHAQHARKFRVHLTQGSGTPWVVTWGDCYRFQGDNPGLTTTQDHATIWTFMYSQDTGLAVEFGRGSNVYRAP